ncbi:phosphate ABC transporter permease [Bisbaumannia pacifica]|uniref:Phosphate ABC transporter permease n=1 Tax=Bisbaumannia pacifica TaxID=77098 RepID=A0A510X745_9GAMM|nr:phosphate ABC transporter permease [Halomonas pacifica]
MIDFSSLAVRRRQRWRQVRDRLATLLISACGIGVIVAVLAIGVFLVMAAWPLFSAPRVTAESASPGVEVAYPLQAPLPAGLEAWLREQRLERPPRALDERLWLAEAHRLARIDLAGEAPTLVARLPVVAPERRISAVASLAGGRSLIIADDAGGLRRWLVEERPPWLRLAKTYRDRGTPIEALWVRPGSRQFLVRDAAGLSLYDALAGERWRGELPAGEALGFDGEGHLLWRGEGVVRRLAIEAPHAEIDWRTLWLPQPYEGHAAPQQRWQSAGEGSLDEPKYGLTPLAWGTLKAAAYALLFAVPLALGAAVFSACYLPRRLRHRLKPTLELMEALPGVVIGFIAGLVLAPFVERHLAGSLALIVLLPLAMLLAGGLWAWLPTALRRHLPLGWAGLWLMPWLALWVALALWASPWLEAAWFGGDLRGWLAASLGLDVEQRNALIVGLAMGFAVIPSIFALAEDALSGVPASLGEGAQALGATRWQTLWKVLLPAAGPGVFSAVMIGAGRAVGETMIVLMATGNTALMSVNPLEGLRSFAANLAIELPEAVPGGTHYRVLLLSALLLFLFTFVVNTLAELVRRRLKRRYRRLGAGR